MVFSSTHACSPTRTHAQAHPLRPQYNYPGRLKEKVNLRTNWLCWPRMSACKWIPALSLLVLSFLVKSSKSIVLCDEGCRNISTDLGICMKDRPPDRTPIYLMGFFPCNVGGFRGRGLTVAGQMATRAIRMSNTTLLQDYNLELVFDNTMVSHALQIIS